ncbi:MAG: anaerobic sulfatase maturase [Candidatus Sumerlaeia bacterium]|nr:anaerobic sulfatase maturase [Candidatus Sumerlaeia bacterium]
MAEPLSFHLMAKPSGPICNLDCTYCFYLEKEEFVGRTNRFRMPDDVLERYVKEYIEAQDVPEVHFAWQGGEPTLMGVDFFRKVVELQGKYGDGKKIGNGFQTNGTLLDDEWGEFLAANDFLVGLSIDGPEKLHDEFRVDKGGRPTFHKVMEGLEVLKKHSVEFNTLTVVNASNVRQPRELYRFLKGIGSTYHQYIPLVERLPDDRAKELGLTFAFPPEDGKPGESPVTPWSVPARQWGNFLAAIFDEWILNDVGTIFVNHFENTLSAVAGYQPGMCVYRETCGNALVVEHNGHVYSCDHFVYPEYDLGNIMGKGLREMVMSPRQQKFGNDKAATLPAFCWNCEFVSACHGECPKHRFTLTPDGEPGLNYLCPGLKRYFSHVWPRMRMLAEIVLSGQDPSTIMETLRPKGRKRRN